jgi:hypothetical protein
MSSSMKTALAMPALDLVDVLAAMPCLMAWRNSKGRIMPLHIKAAPGMGKTVLAEMAARYLAKQHPGTPVGFHIANLGILDPTSVPGYTLFETLQTDSGPEKVSVFTRPTVFSVTRAIMFAPGHADADSQGYVESERDDLGQKLFIGSIVFGQKLVNGITLLDEFMQADVEVRKTAAPLLDEGRVATHSAPPGWAFWAASNRAKDASGTGRALGFLTNRQCMFETKLTIDLTEAYLNGEDILTRFEPLSPTLPPVIDARGRVIRNPKHVDMRGHPAVLAYARQNADTLYAGVPSDPGEPFLSPRSLEAASNLFDVMLRLSVADESGAMESGLSFTDSFINRRESGEVDGVTGDTVQRWTVFQTLLAGTIGQENAAQFLATLELFDEVPTLPEIVKNPQQAHVSSKADAQFICAYQIADGMTKKTADALMQYAKRLNPALYQNIVHNAVTRDGDLLMAQSIRDWMNKNPESLVRMMIMRAKSQPAGRKLGA